MNEDTTRDVQLDRPGELDIGEMVAESLNSPTPPDRVRDIGEAARRSLFVPQAVYRTAAGQLINFRTEALRRIAAGLQKMGHKHITTGNVLSDRTVSKDVEKILLENLYDTTQQVGDVHQVEKLAVIRQLTKELIENRRKRPDKPRLKPKFDLKPRKRKR